MRYTQVSGETDTACEDEDCEKWLVVIGSDSRGKWGGPLSYFCSIKTLLGGLLLVGGLSLGRLLAGFGVFGLRIRAFGLGIFGIRFLLIDFGVGRLLLFTRLFSRNMPRKPRT